jgi:hypothetical protein
MNGTEETEVGKVEEDKRRRGRKGGRGQEETEVGKVEEDKRRQW